MTIYEAMQENCQKFKFSNSGVLYLNTFERHEQPHTKSNKPFSLWKTEEGRNIGKKAKAEINKARVHGNRNSSFEMQDGVLKFVPNKNIIKEVTEEDEKTKEEILAEQYGEELVG